MDKDPLPQDPDNLHLCSMLYHDFADQIDLVRGGTVGLMGDPAITGWLGQSGQTFFDALTPYPSMLSAATAAYREIGDALDIFSGRVRSLQPQFDSEPGGAKPNEDSLGFGPHAAWAIDGATDVYPQPFLPAHNDVHYLVDRLGQILAEHAAAPVDNEAKPLLEQLSRQMRDDLGALRFPPDRTHPTCSLGLLIDRGDTMELARIGDATLVTVGVTVTVVDTDFYNHREAAAVAAAGPAGLTGADARIALLGRRQKYITGVHAEGVFSGHPDAVLRIHSTTLGWDGIEHVLLCTDGFARAVGEYGLYPDWPSLVRHAVEDSLASVAKTIRDYEHDPCLEASHAHFKNSDDLAAVLCRHR